ncbi:MAG: hypothetical protein LW701_00865 [Fluviicola sp.]|jgi:hypothetical protein|nr:hypothetical protein [Fluviicola sp.]
MKILFNKTLIILSVFSLLLNVGCRKKKDTIATVTVTYKATGAAVENAKVSLSPSNPSQQVDERVNKTENTNSSGVAYFNYNDLYQLGAAGVCILNVKAVKDASSGTGIIKIEEEKTTSAGVNIF